MDAVLAQDSLEPNEDIGVEKSIDSADEAMDLPFVLANEVVTPNT